MFTRCCFFGFALIAVGASGEKNPPISTMDPMDIVGKSKEDASLPKATMTKIIKEMLPPDVRVARDAQDLLIECCVEFINLVSSESNEVCNREDKRTIAPEHVFRALQDLGFGEYIAEVYAAYEQHKFETMDTQRSGKWNSSGAEMTEEEAAAAQQRMFAEARARMNNGNSAVSQPEDG
ncbi:PREDICTED: protein Dr1 homolog isoform X2 [Tarenaya hassleriana]|uniref:protein Dr1 homolog isoform X2 n=1 Tax=Tarenaya hassleriana TaxID=28532 RepID=UPI00053C70DC|nr:PREDICTED: protein Dr1 homolog isoform X2 [Tarenaya hassleriana]